MNGAVVLLIEHWWVAVASIGAIEIRITGEQI